MPKKFLLLIGLLCLAGMARADEAPPLPETGSQSPQPRMDKTSKEFKQVYDLAGEVYVDKGLRVSGPFAFLASSGTINYVDIATGTFNVLSVNGSTVLGKIRQIVSATSTSAFSTTSATFQSTNLTASITPTSTSSKIFVSAFGELYAGQAPSSARATLFRNTTNLGDSIEGLVRVYHSAVGDMMTSATITWLDSPATTSATSYTVKIDCGGGNTCTWGINAMPQSIVLIEVL